MNGSKVMKFVWSSRSGYTARTGRTWVQFPLAMHIPVHIQTNCIQTGSPKIFRVARTENLILKAWSHETPNKNLWGVSLSLTLDPTPNIYISLLEVLSSRHWMLWPNDTFKVWMIYKTNYPFLSWMAQYPQNTLSQREETDNLWHVQMESEVDWKTHEQFWHVHLESEVY